MKAKIAKITGIIILLILVYMIWQIAVFEIFKTCGNCGRPYVRPSPGLQPTAAFRPVTLSDLTNLTITYSTNNGSLPPPYHREHVVTITTDSTGLSHTKFTDNDYNKVLQEGSLTVTRAQLDQLASALAKIGPPTTVNGLSGCTGGNSASVRVTHNNIEILSASVYNCAGRTTNQSLNDFIDEAGSIIPSGK